MAYLSTLEDLVVRVKQMMNKANTTFADDTGKPKNSEIIAAINEARNETYMLVSTGAPDRFITSASFTYPSLAENVTLPVAAQQAQVVHVYARDQSTASSFQTVLEPIRVREFANISETGYAKCYAINGTQIRLRPVPTYSVGLTMFYLPALTPLANATDTFPEIPAMFAHLYAMAAAIRLRQINEDPADALIDARDALLERYIAYVERLVPDNHIQLVEQQNATIWQG